MQCHHLWVDDEVHAKPLLQHHFRVYQVCLYQVYINMAASPPSLFLGETTLDRVGCTARY
jgi:hypothetical protein